jgi:hypothetical protein
MTEQARSSVTIYTSGTAVVTKEHVIPNGGPLKLSIPVKKRDLDTVVASISVLGDVTLPEPLSYQPTNVNPTDLILDPNTVTRDLVTKLRGAKVRLKGPGTQIIEGTLAGTQDFHEQSQLGIINRFRVVVMAEDGDIRTVEDRNIDAVYFTDENDRREIQKALQRSYQAIRPESAFVDVTIVPNNGATKCAVRYVTTAPSPKTRYQLRQLGDKWELDAQAVVTNDSEEDWRTPDGQGVYVSVVTGEPIDFDTDLAEISRPRRQKLNLAGDQALGAVGADEEVETGPKLCQSMDQRMIHAPNRSQAAAPLGMSLEKLSQKMRTYGLQHAHQLQADTRDVGDFAVFDCPTSLVINSNKSALVLLKTWQVGEVKPILFYNESKHPRRPWQAKKFKNETGITLSKGVAIVLNEGEFAGKAVLESAQPNEEAILIHALENGVKVFVEHREVESRNVRIKISDGVVLYENVYVMETIYKISNQKAVAFKLEIEHPRQWPGADERHKFEVSSSSGQVRKTQTVSGARFAVELPASDNVIVTVRETQVQEQTISLQDFHGFGSLMHNFINIKHPLAKNRKLQACAAAQQELDQVRQKVQDAEYQVTTIEEEQDRLKGLIPVTHDTDANDLKTEVAKNEQRWRELKRTTIPALKEAVQAKEAGLQKALANLSISWAEGNSGDGNGDGGTIIAPNAGTASSR